jgi:hypothetical protein
MTETMKGLLLEDRWAPVTSDMGFLETSAERAVHAFAAWQGELMEPRGITVVVQPVSGTLEQVLSSLLPLNNAERRRYLFMPTRSAWTAYLDNGWAGPDAMNIVSYMARILGCRGLRVAAVPHTLKKDKGRYGIIALDMYGPQEKAWLNNSVRAVSASNDGGRWVFDEFGEPFPFEKVEQYKARRVRDRFTFDMLKDYLRHLGLSPFEEGFYLPEGAPAWLVRKTGPAAPTQRDYTLAQVRADIL